MEIVLSTFGSVIATDDICTKIYNEIKRALSGNGKIKINAQSVTIATKSSRLIFGKLYKELRDKFNEKIEFINASELFMFSVNEGIDTEMEAA